MALTFDKIKDLIGINGTIGVDLLGSARVRDDLFVSGYLTVGGKKFNGLNINGVKAIDKDVKWKGTNIEISKGGTGASTDDDWKNTKITTNSDGTLNYDGKTATAPSLVSISGTLTPKKGGTGQDLSTSTGAISISGGTVSAGTLGVASGGTGEIANTTWLNSKITTKNDGTLNYDGTAEVSPNLVNIAGTLTASKGGTGQDLSGSTGLIKVSSGSVSAATLVDSDVDASAAIATSKLTGAATSIASHGLATSATTDTTNATNITSGTLPNSQHGSTVTDNLDSNGLKTGRTLGDGVESIIIFGDSSVAGTAAGDKATSVIWKVNGSATASNNPKIVFNYLHDSENSSLKFAANIRSENVAGRTTATLEIYAMNSGGTVAAASTGSVLTSGTILTNNTTFTTTVADKIDVESLTDSTVYRGEIKLDNDNSQDSFITGVMVTSIGSA